MYIVNFLKMKNLFKIIIFLFRNDICAYTFVSNFKSYHIMIYHGNNIRFNYFDKIKIFNFSKYFDIEILLFVINFFLITFINIYS